MASLWFYRLGTEQIGPVNANQIRSLAKAGTILPGTPIRKSDDANWIKATRIKGLFERVETAQSIEPEGPDDETPDPLVAFMSHAASSVASVADSAVSAIGEVVSDWLKGRKEKTPEPAKALYPASPNSSQSTPMNQESVTRLHEPSGNQRQPVVSQKLKSSLATIEADIEEILRYVVSHFAIVTENEIAYATGAIQKVNRYSPEVHLFYALRVSKCVPTLKSLKTLASRWSIANAGQKGSNGLQNGRQSSNWGMVNRFLSNLYLQRFHELCEEVATEADETSAKRRTEAAKVAAYRKAIDKILGGATAFAEDLPRLHEVKTQWIDYLESHVKQWSIANGTHEQFLRSAFNRPVHPDKISILAARTFTDLEGVTDAMSSKITRTLVDGLIQGEGPMAIARQMNEDVENIGIDRAKTIARTEITRVHAEGQLDAMERLGVTELGVSVEWSTSGDEAVCELCAPMEGAVLSVEESRGLLPRHPNCRCIFTPAHVGEDKTGQKRTKAAIDKAIGQSVRAEVAESGKPSSWPGANRTIAQKRPKSILD